MKSASSASLVGLLQTRARELAGKRAYTFLAEGETEAEWLTYADLDRRSRAIGADLQRLGMAGQRVLLLFPPGLDFVAAFFGCLYAGAVAVPAYPPASRRSLPRLRSIASDARPAAALTLASNVARFEALAAEVPELQGIVWRGTDQVPGELAGEWSEPDGLSAETLAFLQYTSGSTSAPKGVMVSHGNLLHNERMIQSAFEQSEESVVVGWLPLYHDMGLIGNVLQPLAAGASCVLMAPVAFLQKPLRWLEAVSRYRATTSGGPNFAYELCVRKVSEAEKAGLDLGSWRVAYSGAEPVRAETLDRFAAAFAGCGFQREAFYPCYGLAEATLFVTGGMVAAAPVAVGFSAEALAANRVEEDAEGRPLVGCGGPWLGQEVAIVDPETGARQLGEAVGEIWVAGPSVAQGYWNRPDVTAQTFQARLAGEPGAGPFLRTGDLGFLRGGQLFVTGRLKDLIIIRGRNLYPQDVELTAERSHSALRPGCGAAFAVDVAGEERLVVVQEVERHRNSELEDAAAAIRRAVAEEHEVQVHDVVLVRTGTIAKTSSGKIQRHASRQAWLEGSLEVVGRSPLTEEGTAPVSQPAPAALDATALTALPAGERIAAVTAWVGAAAARALRISASRIDPRGPLAALGLDSLGAVELKNELEVGLGASLPLTSFLGDASVESLAGEVLAGGVSDPLSVEILDSGAEHPLTHGQEGLWFLDRLDPGNPAYIIAGAARVRGLDVAALRRSFERLAERHAALRTTFAAGEGGPVQRIGEEARFDFVEVDASSWSEGRLARCLADFAFAPFDLEAGPLLRAGVFHRLAGESCLVLSVHHIVADLWSLGVLLSELGELYAQGGHQSPWPPLAASFAEHARRQRRLLASPEGARLEAYWLEALGGNPEPLDLPTDRSRPRTRSGRGGVCSLRLDADLVVGLRELAARRGVTPFAALLASYQVLLARYSGQSEVLVGSPTTGRGGAGGAALGSLLGYFVNPVVLRGDLSGEPSFGGLLDRSRSVLLEAFAHQDFPFPLLAERLQPERDPSRPPVFQAALALQKARRPEEEGIAGFALGEAGARLSLGGLELESLPLARRYSQFDLTLLVADEREGLTAALEHDADLFDLVTARRMLGHFRNLLAGALTDPDTPVSRLPLLNAAERHQALVEWNGAGGLVPEEVPVHEQLDRWAEEMPEAAAVIADTEDEELRLTYEELKRRADSLARHLRSMGIGPESRVALGLERSPELVTAALGTLKAGGAYLPLDPEYPAERLRYVLDDAGASALLTVRRLAGRFGPPEGVPVLFLDEALKPLPEDGEDPSRPVLPENLAYVIYTSGSTGLPKGTELRHEGLAGLVRWHREAFGLRPGDRTTLLAGPGFDASVWEMWSCLASGGTLCIPRRETVASPEALVRWLAERGIQSAFLPTPLAEALLEQELPSGLALRTLLTGGDRLRSRPPAGAPFRLFNCYGPTEATVVATSSPVPARGTGLPAIGRPLPETRGYVVDRTGEPVPVGVAGELWLGGAGLARGYLRRPGLTAEKFIPDPFSVTPGARLYRTGDLVRLRQDGDLEFLGRIDHQVKVRGFRIELGEIEACLTAHPAVREAVVLARPDSRGDNRLVAWVVTDEATADLASFLRSRLPEHMVPTAWSVLESLPLTPNGKVDRKALPEPEGPEQSMAPRTPEEELLAGIFAEVLGRERVGTSEDFFALGGHSLLATRVASRVREAFGVDLPLRLVFEAPTVAELAGDLAGRMDKAPGLTLADRTGDLPLSFAQERLWFLEQLQPGLPTYNVPAAVRLEGELDVDALRRALSEVVARHEALRTTFEERGGRPVQRIAPEGSVELAVVDLREDELALVSAEEARRPFDLAKGPLLRARLLRLSSREHVLLLTMHHIVSDGWSVGVLVRELGELYAAGPASLEPLSVQYADYAAWQRDWLRDEALASRLSWWRERLAGAPSVLELPSDRPRPAVSSGRGGQVRVAFPSELSRNVEDLARRRGVTRFMVLLAGFAALLHRYGGQDEVVVGAPIAGRTRRELEPLVGLFVNSLALRVDLTGDPAFAGLLALARETALEAYAWQDLPFEKLVEELAPQRSLAHNPIFQVMLAVQPAPELSLPGLAVRRLEVDPGASRMDLMLSLEEGAAGLAGFLEYSSDLFDAATVERLAGHLGRLLAAAAEDETRRIWDLPLLSGPERLQVVEEWNRTAAPFPSDLCLHELVATQVARTPDAEALVWGEESLTYAELWRRSGQVAARLHVEPGERVGVLSERTPWMVAGLLGVLRAGAAYVPMDPAYPAERLAYIAEDARLSAVLTTEGLAGRVDPGVPKVLLEDGGEVPFEDRSPGSRNLAYIIYTSGSTGRPKGVAIEHRSAVALLSWAAEEFSAGELAGVLAATSICFDLSVFELFLPLALGGTVILADDALALASLPAAGRVRLINTVPSAIAELERAGAIPPSVRTINLAGEPLRRALADRLYRHETVERVLNLYGPSEDTTYSTWALVERDGTLAPPIGRPLSNSQAYVLDRRMEPVPVGVPGVLYLGGAGLARGYFGRPELTAERFIPNPFGGPGERLYDTGDLVRWLPDGNLDFLGRVDHQVKVRGFRIELGEVESAAGAHPAVQEAVAVVRRSGEEASLVLYVAPRAGQVLTVRDLRSFLGSRLPAYMVPSAIVLLEALPLTPNGKVDRKALPEPDFGAEGATGATAPRTPAEELLAGIWADVLGVPAVGVHDGFFDLGGHSLLATRVVARVRQAFGVELPLRALFEQPTVASLATRIEGEMGSAPELPPVVPVPRGESLPLSYAQQRLWFLDQLEPGSPLYNVPVALRLSGRLDAGALAGAFREVVRRHEALRTVFTSRDGAPVQVLLPEVEVGLDALDLRDLPAGLREAETDRRMREEARRPFDLERGPLFRLALFRLAEEEHLLLVTLHHIVSDGWSMGVLVREVAALYAALSQGWAADLPALPVQYADYAMWQRSWLEGGALEAQLAYWRERLGGAPAVLEVPADRPRPLMRSHRGASRPFSLPAGLSAALAALARGREATPFMTLLAGFQALLARWCGRDEVSVATAIAGRRHVETEALIGFFVNTLVLRTSLAGEPGFGELLGRVRETTLGAYTHQDLPFERLVEEIQPERSLAHAPLAQVMLVLQNAPLEELELPGLDARVIELDNGAAKLDLTLLARETGDGFAGTLVYDAELFTEATAARLLDHLRELLAGAAADPERPWTALPLLTRAERAQLLEQGSAVQEATQPVFIHELFAGRARTAPDAPALRCEDLDLTYAGLDRRADLLARRLRALGVGPEIRVALYADRSAEMVVGLLAVLKAGGAYVPIDPGAPAERIAFVLADTAAPVALVQASLADRLPVREGLSMVLLDGETAEERLFQETDLEPVSLRPENLAYVIYTSGSTGRPKGVAVEHRQLANYVLGVTERLGLEGCASFATVSTLAADLGNTALFPALVTGACLHVISRERAADPEAFAEYFERHGVDVLKIVPSHLAALQSVERPERGLPRRRLVLGGEATTWELADLLRSRAPQSLVCNHYGPTETTVGVLARPVPGEEERLSTTVPLGRPLPGSRVYVLDRRQELLPAGVPGELCIGGAGLSRGYLGRPDLTAERFVPDPFSGPGERIYRTGDLARVLPNGEVEFLGRIDHQIKIRGFRVEPGEVAAALERHPAVREAVVLGEGGRLIAYVVPAAEEPSAAGLRDFLSGELPDYMIPAAFVFLTAIPLTPNGKVDREALPRPEMAVVEEGYVAPRTPVEETLAGIWAELLGLDRVGIHDGFFDLGGHSLMATRLISRVRRTFQVELPLRSLFEAPTPAGLALAVEAARRAGTLAAPPLVRRDDSEGALSFSQERLWFLDQLHPGQATYNVPYFARLEGALDAGALVRALAEISRRHESLRTTFPAVDGRPVPVVSPEARLELRVEDLRDLPADQRAAEAARRQREEAERPFDLADGPLARAVLLHLGEQEHELLLTFHHVVSDAWSRGVLTRELEALYAVFASGRPSPLPELPLQYADFAAWQRAWMRGEVLEGELDFWRMALGAGSPPLQLPADRPRPAVLGPAGGVHTFRLEAELGRSVRDLAGRHGATPFMVLLAGFAALLGRLSSQDDVTVGSPVANRNRAETEGLIGFFVNTLALRVRMDGDPVFGGLVEQVRATALGAYDHQDLPFEKLVEAVFRERALDRSPVFQTAFLLQNAPAPRPELPGLAVTPLEVHNGTAKFDLTLALTGEGEELAGAFEYAADLFDPATLERWAGHLAVLLRGACADPGTRLSALPVLSAAERRQLLEMGEPLPPFADVCLHELFAATAQRMPAATALVTPEETLTYAALASRAGRLATRLRDLGVGPETRVGVFMERSADLIVGLLAILEAGGAYVPLDPAYPEERLAFMAADAGLVAVLASERLADRLPGRILEAGIPVVSPAVDGEAWTGPVPATAVPGNLAYLIYTSGSTGRPKAVAIKHRSAVAMLAWAARLFSPEETEAVLACTSISFDLSVFEIFLPLSRGGRVVLAENALALPALPAAGEVTLVNTVPSAMNELVRMGAVPPSVRTVNLAGEPLPRALADRIYALGTVEKVFNLYGPSEDTTYSTWSLVPESEGRPPAIGRPVAGSQGYVVDAAGGLAPWGVAGELWLGGAGLARGYLGRPELTAEKFIPDPFGGTPGGRLYRTGDLVRLRQDGELEFLGRIDHQVKVRGFRIELGEIEACLTAHPAVREAVVQARDNRLVAWIVAEQVPADLGAFLRERLPEHMVPTAWSLLASLPLTPNGKVDRKALPEPEEASGPDLGAAPRIPEEELLAGIFAEVLGRERVGTGEDFFALGGHSLLATRVASRVREAFGVELPVRRVFEAPTVAELAQDLLRTDKPAAPALTLADRFSDLPLSFAQERLWFLEQLQPGLPTYNVPAAVRLDGELDVDGLRWALSEVVARHEALRTTFEERAGRPVQQIAEDGSVELALVDLEGLGGAEAALAAAEEARRPFDLVRGPLVRASLLRLSNREHVLLLTMHHIVSDGWSVGVLVRELGELYAAGLEGRPASLEPLSVQYADYAAWQREWLKDEALEARLSWWRERLAGAPSVLELPADRLRPAVSSGRGEQVRVAFSPELSRSVEDLARRRGATRFMVLLAGFAALLHRYGGQEEVVVGAPIAGRTRRELEPLVGLFVNSLALRVDLSGDPAFAGLLARARETALEAYAWQDLPFEKLVEELAPQRSLAHNPVFQVMLSVQPALPALTLPGLAVRELELDAGASRLDLTLSLEEKDTELAGFLEYSSDLFDAATVERLAGHLARLLAAAAADEGQPVWDLPLLSEPERLQVVEEWNRTAAPFSADVCLHELVTAQVARTPDAEALVWGEESLTFAELWWMSGQVAARLVHLGIEVGGRVGVLSERTPWMVAGLLGVLRAGAAYVPMDPAYPAERLAYIAENGELSAVLTTGRLAGLAGEFAPGLPQVILGAELESGEVSLEGRSNLSRNLAYLIYTSGSTGRPKGVAIEHRSAVAMLSWSLEMFPPEEIAGMLASTSICFDMSVFELFLPLAVGGTIFLADDALQLRDLPAAGRVRLINTVPSAIAELDRAGAIPPSVRTINLGGEPLRRALVDRLYRHETVERVLNLYGPSEDTTYSTWSCVERESGREPVIGYLLSNSQGYVLDRRMKPVPVGVTGVLYLAGAGLARGYFGRPELTAEKFIPNPFGAPGERLYDTGDLVRWLPDGTLDYLGRIDHQVKVRGFRVELGEVESAAGAHPAVQEAVALVRRSTEESGASLVLYAVPRPGEPLTVKDLRGFLGSRLPSYMVPSGYVLLEALPLNPNGKVDRKVLAGMAVESASERPYTAPRTPVEETLAGIWRSVLGVERVGIHDDFFELGGHSLLATQVLTRVRETFEVPDLPLRQLFQEPTVAELALTITQRCASDEDTDELLRTIQELKTLSPEDLAVLLEQETDATTESL